ncbi:alpha/beta hydrolase [Nocardia sp. NPDC046763]|uniref:alpha/beta fold hydrolase n=1 Tax=Nocardia sp. NPDC046763 TaxID=3155256 RepID=UPI0033D997BB
MTSGPVLTGVEKMIELPDADLHIYEAGPRNAEPLVLLHGFLTSAITWRGVADALSESHRVIVVDLPGCGGSPDPRAREWTASRASDLIMGLFDAMTLDRPTLIGSQMGGSIAAFAAGLHPDRVSRLVIMAAGALGEGAANLTLYRALATPVLGPVLAAAFPRGAFTKKWLAAHGSAFVPDHEIIRTYHDQLRKRGHVMARFGLGVRLSYGESFDALAQHLLGLDVPTLLLFGAADQLVPPSTGRRFAELMPRSRLVLLDGCGDFPQEEAPTEVATQIAAFLAE